METYPLLILQDSLNLVWLLLALFIAGVFEAFLWKTPLFEPLNRPIQSDCFGKNKRWRGLVSLPLTHAIAVGLLQLLERAIGWPSDSFISFSDFNWIEYGLLVGFIFNLAELPNSFVKRRLNIPPGDESNWLFYLGDHMDSTYGTLLLWWLYFRFPLDLILTGTIATPLLFILATEIRKKLGLK
ncbi:CDP-archaeol synthase [Oxynema sp. CENA135]|uniref:CDP-archaeol synthase n=1 Tax=Oxynema sp. CENA135 TaxID=984206 RepID=UPI001909DB1B|nr:CDP-archaeol synthase [Oxynema sp. CENA135]MBK4732651.1 CDP-archaeol synthase [Oxynema sp. CENA135]